MTRLLTGNGAAIAAVLALVVSSCSDAPEDRVIVEDGTLPPTSAPVTTLGVPSTTPPPAGLGPPTLSASSSVSTVGIDEITFGMPLDEAAGVAGATLDPVEDGHDPTCYVAAPAQGPPGLTFTVVDGRVERLDLTEAGVTTRSGAGVGTTVADLEALFPDRLQPATGADPAAPRLVFVPEDAEDAEYRIFFETDGASVVHYWAGRLPVVEDGC